MSNNALLIVDLYSRSNLHNLHVDIEKGLLAVTNLLSEARLRKMPILMSETGNGRTTCEDVYPEEEFEYYPIHINPGNWEGLGEKISDLKREHNIALDSLTIAGFNVTSCVLGAAMAARKSGLEFVTSRDIIFGSQIQRHSRYYRKNYRLALSYFGRWGKLYQNSEELIDEEFH